MLSSSEGYDSGEDNSSKKTDYMYLHQQCQMGDYGILKIYDARHEMIG